jgi:hypothetical protein
MPVPTAGLRDAIGVFLVTAFVGALGVLFWKAIPSQNEQLIVYMLGQLSGFVAGVVSFHYVTKAGDREMERKRADNTAKALDAIKEVAKTSPAPSHGDAAAAAEQVAGAAVDEAEEIKKGG